jgi:BlaI family transcriptional regulator, penicillinase repressor
MQISLTDREAEFMRVLWEYGPSTVTQVRARLPDNPAYTTVLSILRILETKGFVTHAAEGRAHRYGARVAMEAAQRGALRALMHKLFKGSRTLLLTQLVSDQKLTAEEVRRIRALLSRRGLKS